MSFTDKKKKTHKLYHESEGEKKPFKKLHVADFEQDPYLKQIEENIITEKIEESTAHNIPLDEEQSSIGSYDKKDKFLDDRTESDISVEPDENEFKTPPKQKKSFRKPTKSQLLEQQVIDLKKQLDQKDLEYKKTQAQLKNNVVVTQKQKPEVQEKRTLSSIAQKIARRLITGTAFRPLNWIGIKFIPKLPKQKTDKDGKPKRPYACLSLCYGLNENCAFPTHCLTWFLSKNTQPLTPTQASAHLCKPIDIQLSNEIRELMDEMQELGQNDENFCKVVEEEQNGAFMIKLSSNLKFEN